MNETELQLSAVEAHNAIGVGERYHAPPRRIYLAVRNSYPKLRERLGLCLSIKSMNDTMGPEGLVPSLLLFVVIPSLPVINKQLPEPSEKRDRMAVVSITRAEMSTITA